MCLSYNSGNSLMTLLASFFPIKFSLNFSNALQHWGDVNHYKIYSSHSLSQRLCLYKYEALATKTSYLPTEPTQYGEKRVIVSWVDLRATLFKVISKTTETTGSTEIGW